MSIDLETVSKLSKLSMLKFDEESAAEVQQKLGSIVDFISQLQEVETEGVEPMASTVGGASTPEREDVVVQSEQREEFMGVSPASEMSFYVVPRVVE